MTSTALHKDCKSRAAKCLLLLFFNFSFWLLAALTITMAEQGFETTINCGVKRVKRDFISLLWHHSQNSLDELEWKSLARKKLLHFENEVQEAVIHSGLRSYSNHHHSWSLSNALIYVASLATTTGFDGVYPSTSAGKMVSMAVAVLGSSIFLNLLMQVIHFMLICRPTLPFPASLKTDFIAKWMVKKGPAAAQESGQPIISDAITSDHFQGPVGTILTRYAVWMLLSASTYYFLLEWGLLEAAFVCVMASTSVAFGQANLPQDAWALGAMVLNHTLGLVLFVRWQMAMQVWIGQRLDQIVASVARQNK